MMLVKRFSLFLLVLLFISAEVKPNGLAQKDSIQSLIRSYQYDEALRLLDFALLEDTLNKELYASKGFVMRELYSYGKAVDAYSKALELDSTDQQLLTELGNTYKLSQDYPNAVLCFSKALAMDTTNRFLQLETATCKLLNDEFDNSITDFWKIYQKDSLNTYVLKSLGYSFNQIEQTALSIQFYQKALTVNPNDVGSVLSLGNLYLKDKRYADCIQVTDAYRALDTTNKVLNSRNAYYYLLDKKYNEAIQRFTKCIAEGDSSKFNCKNLGIAYYSIDEYDAGKNYLETAYGLDPEDASTVHFLGICCYRSFYKELGIRYLEEAIKLYKPSEEKIALVYRNYAEACKGWDKCPSEKKISSDLRAYDFNPADSTLARDLANEYETAKNYAKAIEYLEIYTKTLKEDEQVPAKYSTKLRYEKNIAELKVKLAKQTESVAVPK